jgi:cyclase
MLKKRIIPALIIKDNLQVKTRRFKNPRPIGSIIEAVKLYDLREVDELIVLDISKSFNQQEPDYKTILEISKECFVPLAIGGGITNINIIYKVLKNGADKVIVSSEAIKNPLFIKEASKEFGSQCIVVSLDYYQNNKSLFLKKKNIKTDYKITDFAIKAEEMGAGELLITCVNKEGTMEGYDYDTIKDVKKKINIPLLASGGAGSFNDMLRVFKYCNADAVVASSIYCFGNKTPKEAKLFLKKSGVNVRV